MRRPNLLLAPALLGALVASWPLIAGGRTLVMRDVLNTHLALRAYFATALRAGELALLDPLRSGGQALLGNLNALPFYPDNLLLLASSTIWQLNAHFWIHWLVAIGTAAWLARAWGLGREGAAAAATVYAFSGYFLSQLNLYNAVAGVALAPGLTAALLELGEPGRRRRATFAIGLIWALLILGGDPFLAGFALVAGVAVAWARHGRRLPFPRLAAALALGTAAAAPQIVETLRVLGESYRGSVGYPSAMLSGRSPLTAIELLLPTFFGRLDLQSFWGAGLFAQFPPLYLSLFPGLVAVVLALVAGAPRRREERALALLAALGLVLAFDLPRWSGVHAVGLPGAGAFRFPEKALLVSFLALALASGRGLERLAGGERRMRAGALALAAAALLAGYGAGLRWGGFGGGLRALLGPALPPELLELERQRWAQLAFAVALSVALLAAAAVASRRSPRALAPAVLILMVGSQLALLSPLLLSDEASYYRPPTPLSGLVPVSAVLVQGGVRDVFGKGYDAIPAADRRYVVAERRAASELYLYPGLLEGRRYEFAYSIEGLDTFASFATGAALRRMTDEQRIAVLRATGVERLVLHRALEPEAAGGARLVATMPSLERDVRVYELPDPLPPASLVGGTRFAPSLGEAIGAVLAPGFDPVSTAVIAGMGELRTAPSGSARLRVDERERVEAEVESERGGYVVLRRAYLPIWRAEIDGRPARPVIANLTRLAVEVPPGRHVVRLWVSRVPLRLALLGSLLGLAGLVALARAGAPPGPGRAGP